MSLLALLCLLSCLSGSTEPVEHTVVRGDTLGKLAKTHGVTVAQIKAWNGLSSDRIDVGQVLVVGREGEADPKEQEPVAQTHKPRKKKRSTGGTVQATVTSSTPGLVMPAPKACLSGPTEADAHGTEAGFASSQGLSHAQVKAGMDAALPGLVACVDGAWPVGRAELELTAGCDGRIRAVRVVDDGGLDSGLLSCVRERLGYAEFPAHDLPDGETFVYPLVFSE